MSFSAQDVKDLREKTGAGMMDCKAALGESKGDMEKAVEYLRKKGLAAMSKKASRSATEGAIGTYVHNGKIGVMVEVNCETDFVARNEDFVAFVKDIAMHIAATDPSFLKAEEMDAAFVEKERRIYTEQLIASGKPENMIGKIVEGKISKLATEVCLLEQKFVKNPDKTIMALIADLTLKLGEKIEIRRFVRYALAQELN